MKTFALLSILAAASLGLAQASSPDPLTSRSGMLLANDSRLRPEVAESAPIVEESLPASRLGPSTSPAATDAGAPPKAGKRPLRTRAQLWLT